MAGNKNSGRRAGYNSKKNILAASLAREYTEECIKVLVDVMRNGDSHAVQIAAAVILLNRGWGKPTQDVNFGGQEGGKQLTIIHEFINAKAPQESLKI